MTRSGACRTLGCVLLALAGTMAPREASAQQRVYVASQDDASVTVLDALSGEVLQTVRFDALGYGSRAMPHHVVVEPDGSHWYVSLIGAGKVLKLDRAGSVVGEVDVETAGMLALDGAGDLLYASRSMSAVRPPSRIAMIDRGRMTVEEIEVFVAHPHALTIDPHGGHVYAGSMTENRLARVPLGQAEADLQSFDGPMHMLVQLAVSPDGRWLVGSAEMTGELLVWDLESGTPVGPRSVALGGQPWDPLFTPAGREVWIPNLREGSVHVVDTSTWSVVDVIRHPALAEPHGSAVDADGRTVFVSGRNTRGTYGGDRRGTVVAIDTATRSARWVSAVGPYAAGVAVSPVVPRATR